MNKSKAHKVDIHTVVGGGGGGGCWVGQEEPFQTALSIPFIYLLFVNSSDYTIIIKAIKQIDSFSSNQMYYLALY